MSPNATLPATWRALCDAAGEAPLILPLSTTSNPTRYWSDLKKRMMSEEEIDMYDMIVHVKKLPDKKGRMTPTNCANAEVLLRIVQSVRSPKAEPFKMWLARVGAMMMDDQAEHTERISHRTQPRKHANHA
jgi:hypothetical protein